jgi:1,4-alpha-glucan branching enzyme
VVRDLNRIYKETPALWNMDTSPEGFRWIDADDAMGNVFSFLRYAKDGSALACVANFSGSPHDDYNLGLPYPGSWEEVLNTDAYDYAGSGVGNLGTVEAIDEPRHGLPYSARLRVPPLGALWLRQVPVPASGVQAVDESERDAPAVQEVRDIQSAQSIQNGRSGPDKRSIGEPAAEG